MKLSAPCPYRPRATDIVEGGFQCSKCRRVVYDMRLSHELNEEDWKEGNRCGIFRTDQLEPIGFSKVKKIYFALLLILAAWGWNVGPIRAQDLKPPNAKSKKEASVTVIDKKNTKIRDTERKLHWWQFRKKRKKRQTAWIGCPSF